MLIMPVYLNINLIKGVLKNVPTDIILRPQRTTELMIVMDFNAYESDDKFNYQVCGCTNQQGGVVVSAFASQCADLGTIALSSDTADGKTYVRMFLTSAKRVFNVMEMTELRIQISKLTT